MSSRKNLKYWHIGLTIKSLCHPLLFFSFFTLLFHLQAAVRLPALISPHMVLQRNLPIHIWGWADPGEHISVSLAGQTASTTAASDGRWEVFLEPLPAGGPFTLRIQGTNTIQIHDVYVGEVWVASGQSNMEWPVEHSMNAPEEIRQAHYPQIRFFKVEHRVSDQPLDDVTAKWEPISPDTVPGVSAVAYFFARHLHEELHVPIGILQSSWGGTPAEAWTPMPALKAEPTLQLIFDQWAEFLKRYPEAKRKYDEALRQWEKQAAEAKAKGQPIPNRPRPPIGPGHQWSPSGLYNAMIAPLTPYPIRGVIWYQGESNANRGHGSIYQRLFETMIRSWRQAWGIGDFPFLFVQLANYARVGPDSQWPEIRDAQLKTLALRNTAMAVTIDIGNPNDIHPRNKQEVGRRLALAALHLVFGRNIPYSGPIFRQLTREGSALRIWFDHSETGLIARPGPELDGFYIAGPDKVFRKARARIEANTVILSHPNIPNPVAVRYAWEPNPPATLFNGAGLPASPFRSDQWDDATMEGEPEPASASR